MQLFLHFYEKCLLASLQAIDRENDPTDDTPTVEPAESGTDDSLVGGKYLR